MTDMAVQKMHTKGMNGVKKRSWVDVNEEDSQFIPTTRTTGSESYNLPMKCVKIGTNDVTIEKHSESTDM